RVAAINHAARTMFRLKASDVSRPLKDLQISYKPVELRSLIERVERERRPVVSKDATWQADEGPEMHLDVQISPLISQTGSQLGVVISLVDITSHRRLESDLEGARRELETAYEELQSTVEELETTNEELQSTNEELETTNEELQSTNEELETMNEELHSTNEELEAMNDEQRERASELDRLNIFLEGILGNLGVGVVVLDLDQQVQLWNAAS